MHEYAVSNLTPYDRYRVWQDSGGVTPAVITVEGAPVEYLEATTPGQLLGFECAQSPVYIGKTSASLTRIDPKDIAGGGAPSPLSSRSKKWATSDIAAYETAPTVWTVDHQNAHASWDAPGTQVVIATGGDYDLLVGGVVSSDGTKNPGPIVVGVYLTGPFSDIPYEVTAQAFPAGASGSYNLNDIRRMYLPAGTIVFVENDSPAGYDQLGSLQVALWLVQADNAVPLA